MKQYIATDLKLFYASVECIGRVRDPLTRTLLLPIRYAQRKRLSHKTYFVPDKRKT